MADLMVLGLIRSRTPFYLTSQYDSESESSKCIQCRAHAGDSFSDSCFYAKGMQIKNISNKDTYTLYERNSHTAMVISLVDVREQ